MHLFFFICVPLKYNNNIHKNCDQGKKPIWKKACWDVLNFFWEKVSVGE